MEGREKREKGEKEGRNGGAEGGSEGGREKKGKENFAQQEFWISYDISAYFAAAPVMVTALFLDSST